MEQAVASSAGSIDAFLPFALHNSDLLSDSTALPTDDLPEAYYSSLNIHNAALALGKPHPPVLKKELTDHEAFSRQFDEYAYSLGLPQSLSRHKQAFLIDCLARFGVLDVALAEHFSSPCGICMAEPCVCGDPHDDDDDGSITSVGDWICPGCRHYPCICNDESMRVEAEEGEWICHTCYTKPCVCGTH